MQDKKQKSPAFQWYPKDIMSSARVAMMDLKEEGAYRRAIDFCWINGFLPNDDKKLSRMIGKGCTVSIAKVVREMFEVHPENKEILIHARLDEERHKQLTFRKEQSERAHRRWDKQKCGGISPAMPPHIPNDANDPHYRNDALQSSSSSSINKESKDSVNSADGLKDNEGLLNYKSLEKNIISVCSFITTHDPKFPQPYIDCWNLFAEKYGFNKIKALNDDRKRKLKARLTEENFDFIGILVKAKDSTFIKTNTFFTFNWVIHNQENYLKILEGNYDNKKPNKDEPPVLDYSQFNF